MNLSTLTPAAGSINREKRIGRGQGSGHGQSSTRGTKGQQSRSGYHKKKGFEGGQQPIQKRLPKFGFKNPNRVEFRIVNLHQLQKIATSDNITDFDISVLKKHGLVAGKKPVKILGNGTLEAKLIVKANAFSESAKSAIEAKGGSAIVIPTHTVNPKQVIIHKTE